MAEPNGCKGCESAFKFARWKLALEQTKKRWAWFLEARKLDDECSTRLGTLGYLHWEIRAEIFRRVIEDYMERKRFWDSEIDFAIAQAWPLHKVPVDDWDECFYLRLRSHESGLSKLLLTMPLRIATFDTKFEVDHVIFSTETFWFDCPSKLRQFLGGLSADHRSRLRSINIVIFQCEHCRLEGVGREYSGWRSACDQLPSSLPSVKLTIGSWVYSSYPWTIWDTWRMDQVTRSRRVKRAKELVEFLSCQILRTAMEAEVAIVMMDKVEFEMVEKEEAHREIDLVVQQTISRWSNEYVQWKRSLESAEG